MTDEMLNRSEDSVLTNCAERILKLILLFHRRTRLLYRKYGTALPSKENYLLALIESGTEVSPSKLAVSMQLSRGRIAQLLHNFQAKGYIQEIRSEQDRRYKIVEITKRGHEVLLQDNALRQKSQKLCFESLTFEEQERLRELMDKFLDQLNAPLEEHQPGEYRIWVVMRRLTRVFGFLGRRFIETEMTPLEIHTLDLLIRAGGPADFKSLVDLIPYDQSSISRSVSGLEQKGFLKRTNSTDDSRRTMVQILPNTASKVQDILGNLIRRFEDSFSVLGEEDSKALVEHLEKSFLMSSKEDSILFRYGAKLEKIKSEDQRKSARSFLVAQLVSQDASDRLSEKLFIKDSYSYSLTICGKMAAVCEIQPQADWSLTNYAEEEGLLQEDLRERFLLGSLEDFFLVESASDVELAQTCLAHPHLKENARQGQKGTLRLSAPQLSLYSR